MAWQTAYLKVHHTACFTAGNLCLSMDSGEKMRALVEDARAMGVTVLPPDVNVSEWFFTVPNEKTVRFGLGAIKGVGQNVVEELLDERLMNGPYLDIFDLAARVPGINRKILEQMIRAGAFDSIDPDRGKLFANVHQALSAAQTVAASVGQASLFADENGVEERIVSWVEAERWDDKRKFTEEKQAYGFCLTGDMFDAYRQEVKEFSIPFKSLSVGKTTQTIAGIVQDVRVIQGKRGRFAVVVLSDGQETIDVCAYSETYDRYKNMLKADEVLVIAGRGRLDERMNRVSMTASQIMTIEEVRLKRGARLVFEMDETANTKELKKLLTETPRSENGVLCEAIVNLKKFKGCLVYKDRLEPTDRLISLLRGVDGVSKARYEYGQNA